MQKKDRILVVTTGGTIDAIYSPEVATPYHVPLPATAEETGVPGAFEKMGLADQCEFYPYSMKDSKKLTSEDIGRIAEYAVAGGFTKVMITTGTDRMADMGQYLTRRIEAFGDSSMLKDLHVVFTGAMGPLRDEQMEWRDPEAKTLKNDGWSNLRQALHDLQHSPKPGVHIRIGENLWEADKVTKDVLIDYRTTPHTVIDSGFRQLTDPPLKHLLR